MSSADDAAALTAGGAPSRAAPARTAGLAAAAALVGLVLGYAWGYIAVWPWEAEMREAVEDLVPPEATVTDRGSGGSEWDPLRSSSFAFVRFQLSGEAAGGDPVESTRTRMREAGWRSVTVEDTSAGSRLHGVTTTLEGRSSIRHRLDPPANSRARVGRRQGVIHATAWVSGAAGAVAAALLGWWLVRRARLRARRAK